MIQTYAASNPGTPQYKTTIRQHDYPFIYFGEDDPPRIHSINTPWNHIQQMNQKLYLKYPERVNQVDQVD